MTELFCGAERAREAWESIGRYNRFQREHAALWGAAQTPEVSMAVWGRDNHPEADEDWQRTRFLTALAQEGLQFDVVLNRQADARMLSRYPLLWLPSVEVVEDQELDILETYLREGGRLLATGVFAECEMIGRPRTQQARQRWIDRLASAGGERWLRRPDWNDRGVWRGKAEIPAPVLEMREHFPTRVTCEEGPVIWTVWRCADGRLVVFLLNPDQRAPRHDVRVTVGHTSGQTRWHSPDADCGNAEIHNHADTVECRVSRLDIFGFLEIGGT